MRRHYGYTDERGVHLDFWLILDAGDLGRYNNRPGVRVMAGPPALKRTERAIRLNIELPAALFNTPQISATIKVEQPASPVHIDTSAITDAVRGAVGMDVDIRVVEPGDDA